ncbi:MAG TPA: hypothetical protein VKZ60_00925 [Chloroflexota bacterium]|jgi:heme/copper-type cytochrome/quinol oxidase subunit 2|nr:hypothetical protein [Chloroflexota bacterium]
MGSEELGSLRVAVLVAVAATFLVIEALLLRTAWRPRTSAPPPGEESRLSVRLSRAWEMLWAVLPALGLLALLLLGARALWQP